MVFVDELTVRQDDHQIYFAGSVPHGLNGQPIPNLGGGPITIPLNKTDIVVQRSFSNKPTTGSGFLDFFEKINHYTTIISGPAMEQHGANPFTFQVDTDVITDSVFNHQDTLTSRAEIADIASVFKDEIVAVIGLGGTGSYLLDFLVKTRIKEIRAFDGDDYHVHNTYRSPGRLTNTELGKSKAEVYKLRYKNFRKGLSTHARHVDDTSQKDLEGVTFAFICVDKGSARSQIFDLLIKLKIPFIDVGMGLERNGQVLSGMLRVTYYPIERAGEIRNLDLAETSDDPENLYRSNIQISELNALNASLATILYKKIKNFYTSNDTPVHLLMDLSNLKIFVQQ